MAVLHPRTRDLVQDYRIARQARVMFQRIFDFFLGRGCAPPSMNLLLEQLRPTAIQVYMAATSLVDNFKTVPPQHRGIGVDRQTLSRIAGDGPTMHMNHDERIGVIQSGHTGSGIKEIVVHVTHIVAHLPTSSALAAFLQHASSFHWNLSDWRPRYAKTAPCCKQTPKRAGFPKLFLYVTNLYRTRIKIQVLSRLCVHLARTLPGNPPDKR